MRDRAERWGDREQFRFGEQRISFRAAHERSDRLARVLGDHGVERGDRVAVMLENGPDYPIAWFAIAKAGALMVPVNVQYRDADLRHVLDHSGARVVLTRSDHVELVHRARSGDGDPLRVLVLGDVDGPSGAAGIDGELEGVGPLEPPGLAPPDPEQHDLLNLQYTSGTTGFPKACMLTHGYWLRLGELAAEVLDLTDADVILTAQPFSYMDPQWNTVVGLVCGAPLVILPRFSASTFWDSVREHGVTFFYCLGTMPLFLLKQPGTPADRDHRVRMVACSGIVPHLHAELERRWGVPWREAYGMTETGVDLYVPVEATQTLGTGAMGRPVPTKQVRVIDPSIGAEVPRGGTGELTVRGEPMMLGYWNDPEATADTIRDGWLHTGDLVHEDEHGYYHLVGRLKDMIRRSGENVAAAEVEAVLADHPAVLAVAVVPVPDEDRGEEVKAFVQLRPGHVPGRDTAVDVVDHAAHRLARFKVPRFVEFVDEFPMTPSERIAKHELLAGAGDPRANAHDIAATGAAGQSMASNQGEV